MTRAPIVLFVYNRLWHTRQTIQSLQQNKLSAESELFIYSDGPRKGSDAKSVDEVRSYVKTVDGFKRVSIIERDKNWGLANSIIDGVTTIVNEYGKVIVLEDDLVTSQHFLTYMNEALELYADDNRVISIHGYVYPVEDEIPEAFFLPGADCWGWATWKRGWELFNSDGQYLLDEIIRTKSQRAFDFNGAYPYLKMLKDQIRRRNDSWAVRWYASAFLSNRLTLYPGRSLVRNIGNDNSGTHCGESDRHDTLLSKTPINLNNIPVEVSKIGLSAFEFFFRKLKPSLIYRVLGNLRSMVMKKI